MKDNISPEEKLLKLIKGEKKSTAPNSSRQDITISKPIQNPIYSLAHAYLTFTNIRKLIPILFAASVIYFFLSFIYPWIGLKKIKLPDVSSQKAQAPQLELKEKPRPYEFYLQGLGQRRIFVSPSVGETASTAPVVNADLIKDISLVGIISGENPQAVIEDKKTQKTYYLTKGQFIGELQIEDIREGKIILNYKGQRYELYM